MKRDIITNDEGVAIGGYDPVAYFTMQRPVRGKGEFSHHWGGAERHFVNAGNRSRFEAEPERYAPQFGGNCAFAVSLGQNTPGSPEAWAIEDDKLYLNKSGAAKALWKLIPGRIAAGQNRWARS